MDTSSDGISKLPPLPQGTTLRKRMLPEHTASTRSVHRIHVSPKTPFRSITARVRKQLDKNLRQASSSTSVFANRLASRKHASLDERVRAIQRHAGDSGIGVESSGEVLVLGTGRAIEKVVVVAGFFQKQKDCVVRLRTTTIGAIDDVVAEGDEEEEGFQGDTRLRMLSALEVSIKLK
ncbi:Rpp20 subunit of nuclear RNase MRP and P-domain-containing protein [Microdochium trichocladiopsis]|uniref:Rpp20 subunit of nuclear RNase MRP and P-domain-containing protein n=1 Tax=Microdochium trichocladiopsis TaxID=1682393 RepID=A0A9P8YDD8_9PEZI|nr:Rpp20 subunit of nuclear RNase MRP and P-domain-containing protein [Microdochium trichocladiopsis]KAH7037174.1 Rpp20 subunit of nuclear RNase MRP and P-domain-containing protein [Microdochium trichocladiopsis]